jgi:hypothetical protein
MAQAVALMDRERPTMASRPGSRETMSCSAVDALSVRVVMGARMDWVIVALDEISSDMKRHA